jgi:hypothetical protein
VTLAAAAQPEYVMNLAAVGPEHGSALKVLQLAGPLPSHLMAKQDLGIGLSGGA